MISLRLAVLAVLIAAAFAGCLTYFVTPSARVDADRRLPAIVPTKTIERHPAANEQAATAFEQAAETILKRLPDAQASADIHQSPGISPCQRDVQSRVHDQSRPRLAFGVKSRSEGVQSVGNKTMRNAVIASNIEGSCAIDSLRRRPLAQSKRFG
jgi:hypothetical protein